MANIQQGSKDLGISLNDINIELKSVGGAIEAGQSPVAANIEAGHGRVASTVFDGTNSLSHTKETLETQRKDMEEGLHMIASSIQKPGFDGKAVWDRLAPSIDKANEPITRSLDNIGNKIKETAATILDSKLSLDNIARNLLESSLSRAGKDSKEGLDTIASNLLAAVTSLENRIYLRILVTISRPVQM